VARAGQELEPGPGHGGRQQLRVGGGQQLVAGAVHDERRRRELPEAAGGVVAAGGGELVLERPHRHGMRGGGLGPAPEGGLVRGEVRGHVRRPGGAQRALEVVLGHGLAHRGEALLGERRRAGAAGRRPGQDEAVDRLGMGERELLGDHAAEREPEHVAPRQAQLSQRARRRPRRARRA
jgi:hypothetical protein